MGSQSALKELYIRFLLNVRGVSDSSVKHYLDALNYISRYLKEKSLVIADIYEVADIETLENIKQILYSDTDFIDLNSRGHQMYSSGLNNYLRFAEGEDFCNAGEKVDAPLDVPQQVGQEGTITTSVWRRSSIIRNQSLEMANHLCEMNSEHLTFISEKTRKRYVEGHHAIPMKLQPQFSNSLDVYANIVCLCPICHRKIHFGLTSEREEMASQIYYVRAERLVKSGIVLSKDEFVKKAVGID